MTKLSVLSLLIMIYVNYCFGLPTAEDLYLEDEVRIFGFNNFNFIEFFECVCACAVELINTFGWFIVQKI